MHTDGNDGSARALATLGARARTPELLAELAIPADADSLGLARLATMHVAGLLGVPVSRLAELRLAVNEACALLIDARAGAAAEGVAGAAVLRVRFDHDPDRLRITVRGPAPYRSPHPEEIGWVLLQALVGEIRMDTVGGMTTLTLSEPLTAS